MDRYIVGFKNLLRVESSIGVCPRANSLRLIGKRVIGSRGTLASSGSVPCLESSLVGVYRSEKVFEQ